MGQTNRQVAFEQDEGQLLVQSFPPPISFVDIYEQQHRSHSPLILTGDEQARYEHKDIVVRRD